jgi:hypothetical protein
VEQGAAAEAVQLGAADAEAAADLDRELGDLVGVVGGVGVLELDRVGEDGEGVEEGALDFLDQLAAVDRRATWLATMWARSRSSSVKAPDCSYSRFITPQIDPATTIGSESSEPGSVTGLRVR